MKVKIQVFLLESFVTVLCFLPKPVISVISRCLRLAAYPFIGKEREKIFQNCEHILQLPRHSQFARQFCRQVLQHQIESALESAITNHKRRGKDPIAVSGLEELAVTLKGLKRSQKGVIVVTAHLGAWEFVGRYCSKAVGEGFVALAKPSKSRAITEYLDRCRARMNTFVLWTDRKTLLKDMLETMNGNQMLGLVSDQKPNSRKGPVVRFFGRDTAFVSGPAKLAIKTKAPILTVFCMREAPWRYRIIHKTIIDPNHSESDEVMLTQSFASEIERVIRLYPEQWVWNYKRWRFLVN